MHAIRRPLTALAAATLLAAAPAMGKTFKWSSASDIPTWDVHSQNNALGNGVHAAVYESLFYYNSKTFALEPQLATGYKQVSPTQVRITLRPGVKFHDGASFNADDAKFSLDRAMAKTSNYGPYIQGIDRIVKVDDMTIDVFTKGPNPVLLRQMTELRMMDKEWSEKNKSVEPKDIKTKDENYAHRNANGTGPYVLKSWDQDVKLVLVKNPATGGASWTATSTEIVYTPIKSEATRVAALLSGEVDMVLDPSPADLAKLRGGVQPQGARRRREPHHLLRHGPVPRRTAGQQRQGQEPAEGCARAQGALPGDRHPDAINRRSTMRGLAQPTGTLGCTAGQRLDQEGRPRAGPTSVEAAKKLLADAGYAGRASRWTSPAPNNRYINDEEICQAVTAMWATHRRQGQAAHAAAGHLLPDDPALRGQHLHARLGRADLRRALLAAVAGAQRRCGRRRQLQRRALQQPADGRAGRAHQEAEVDQKNRNELIEQALVLLSHQDVSHIPLHNQVIPWAMKKNVETGAPGRQSHRHAQREGQLIEGRLPILLP